MAKKPPKKRKTTRAPLRASIASNPVSDFQHDAFRAAAPDLTRSEALAVLVLGARDAWRNYEIPPNLDAAILRRLDEKALVSVRRWTKQNLAQRHGEVRWQYEPSSSGWVSLMSGAYGTWDRVWNTTYEPLVLSPEVRLSEKGGATRDRLAEADLMTAILEVARSAQPSCKRAQETIRQEVDGPDDCRDMLRASCLGILCSIRADLNALAPNAAGGSTKHRFDKGLAPLLSGIDAHFVGLMSEAAEGLDTEKQWGGLRGSLDQLDLMVMSFNTPRSSEATAKLDQAPTPGPSTTDPAHHMERPVPIAEAATVANVRPDVLLKKLRVRDYPIGGVKGASVADLKHILLADPSKRKRIQKWADEKYPVE